MITATERRSSIVKRVNKQNKISVDFLVQEFSVSAVTIRNDLKILEKNNLLVRAHGFAISNTLGSTELSINEKLTQNTAIKAIIAIQANKLINDGESIILDSGTTTLSIAEAMKNVENLVVMTNSLNIAFELSNKQSINVLMSGGILRKKALSFAGVQAEKNLQGYRFDKLFLGVDGFDLQRGITTYSEQEASLNKLMCDISDQVIAVVDSSKFDRRSFHVIRAFGDIDTIITDSGIPDEYLEKLQLANVEVIIADKS